MLLISRSWWVSSNVAFPRNFVTRCMWQMCLSSFIYMKQDIVWFHHQWVYIYRWFRLDSVYPSAGFVSWCTVNPILTLLPRPSVASPIFLFRRLQAYISQHDWDKLMDQRCFFPFVCCLTLEGYPLTPAEWRRAAGDKQEAGQSDIWCCTIAAQTLLWWTLEHQRYRL